MLYLKMLVFFLPFRNKQATTKKKDVKRVRKEVKRCREKLNIYVEHAKGNPQWHINTRLSIKKKRACIKQATPTKRNRGENRFSSFAKPKHKNSARVLLLLLRSTERRLRQNEWRKRKRTSSVKLIDIKSKHSLRNLFIFEQLSTGVGSWIRTTRKIPLAPSP